MDRRRESGDHLRLDTSCVTTWYQGEVTDAIDPLLLGQRVVAILETGARVATYKLATLMALIDQCIENLPEHLADPLTVPIVDLAHRVMELHWRQLLPFEGQVLRQSSGARERIPRSIRALRSASGASSLSDRHVPKEIADEIRWPTEYNRVVAAARGIYRGQPPGIATWSGYKSSVRFDVGFAPEWITAMLATVTRHPVPQGYSAAVVRGLRRYRQRAADAQSGESGAGLSSTLVQRRQRYRVLTAGQAAAPGRR